MSTINPVIEAHSIAELDRNTWRIIARQEAQGDYNLWKHSFTDAERAKWRAKVKRGTGLQVTGGEPNARWVAAKLPRGRV